MSGGGISGKLRNGERDTRISNMKLSDVAPNENEWA